MNELALFAGAGGGILGGKLLGWRTVCAVEINEFCRERLMQRQDEGHLGPFPIWDDVNTFDGKPWRGLIDVVSGGFPCQDISAAGKGAGIDGARSGLWAEFARIIGEVQPRFAFIENSPNLRTRGLVRVLKDLAALGYDATWCVLGASDVGAPHRRKRMWILAYSDSVRELQPQGGLEGIGGRPGDGSPNLGNSNGARLEERESQPGNAGEEQPTASGAGWWESEPEVGRVADGVANRVDRLRAIGNGQVPTVAALAWRTLTDARLRQETSTEG